jgi:hypothetical protein
MVHIKDLDIVRGEYVKNGGRPRPTPSLKRASAGSRIEGRDDECFICEQPGRLK